MRIVPDGLRQTERLLGIMRTLRNPDGGCPWDQAQNFETIAPHTIEEAYEVAEAIAQGDLAALCGELGDLLFQVVFHAQLATEQGAFDFEQIAQSIADKLERRHPHVFGGVDIATAEEQSVAWEGYKAGERAHAGHSGVLDGVPLALPALTRAAKLGKRAARVGFDWPDIQGVLDKVREEQGELADAIESGDRDHIEHEYGDLLFALVNLGRHLQLDPEAALRGTNRRFESRFRHVEAAAGEGAKNLSSLSIEELEALWQAAKKAQ